MSDATPHWAPLAGDGPGRGLEQAIAALRERGAGRLEPVRLHLIDTLARRAQAGQGAVRQLLDQRLASLVADCSLRCDEANADLRQKRRGVADAGKWPVDESLAELLKHMARQATNPAPDANPTGAPASTPQPVELKALRQARRTWSRLSAGQELSRMLTRLPENAGPLNSHLLVLRSLESMRDISPDYLRRFMSSVNALIWLDDVNCTGSPTQASGANGASPRKPKRPGQGRSA